MKKQTFGYILIVALLVVTSLVSIRLYFRQRTDHDLVDVHTFPHTIGSWGGKDLAITEMEYDILETRNLISREYSNGEKEKIYLFIIDQRLIIKRTQILILK